ncbi:MAG: nickel pincer cofactor biosynthesis protein LarC, partial [Dehalococcoidia bacterium]|nr:nickel pincer cofactor biosynthesis protein LarC [Dehalococcoidia bacterium]
KKKYRLLKEIKSIIENSRLSPALKEKGIAVFQNLVKAEGKVHGVPPGEVKLYEVGAVDAIIDIMGAVVGFDLMGLEKVYSSALPAGQGSIRTDHGYDYPVPAPATMELLARAKAPVVVSGDPWRGEMVTPTGAAIITTLASFEKPSMTIEAIGCGAASREIPGLPNILRLWVGSVGKDESLVLIETNIDDMSPEISGYVMERLFQLGARDVWFTPIFMKKNRPATMLTVTAARTDEPAIVETLFRETTTLGLRVRPLSRHEAGRETVDFKSSLGTVSVKIKKFRGQVLGVSPEYDHCCRIAREKGLPLQDVLRMVESEARERFL